MTFQELPSGDEIREVINSSFDITLDISGDWGYTRERALHLGKIDGEIEQIEHMLASMRAYLEMNMTQPQECRYGAINVNERSRERVEEEGRIYDKVVYEASGMLESEYAAFIEEYKERYDTPGFDIADHFRRREASRVTVMRPFWFDRTALEKR